MEKYISNIEYLIEKCHSYDGNIWDDRDKNTIIYKINLDDQFKKFFDYIKDIEYWVKLTKNPKKANKRDLDTLQKILLDKEQWLTEIKMDLTAALAFISAHNTEEFYNKMNECFEVNKHTTYPQLVSYIELYKKIKNSKKNIKNIKSRMKKNKKRIEKNLERIEKLLPKKEEENFGFPSSLRDDDDDDDDDDDEEDDDDDEEEEDDETTVGGKGRSTKKLRITKRSITKRSITKRSITKRSITKRKRRQTKHKRSNHKRLKHNSNKRTTRRRH